MGDTEFSNGFSQTRGDGSLLYTYLSNVPESIKWEGQRASGNQRKETLPTGGIRNETWNKKPFLSCEDGGSPFQTQNRGSQGAINEDYSCKKPPQTAPKTPTP